MPLDSKLTKEVRLSFRDQLREARLKALKDAEAFEEIVFVLERLGRLLTPQAIGLGTMRSGIVAVASESPLSSGVPDAAREVHAPFEELYEFVRRARNDAMHEGAFARYATDRAIELTLVLENALMNGYNKVSDFMVRNPVCAALWHPLSFVRQTMLVSSFSCLPVNVGSDTKPEWHLVSDTALAQYLGLRSNGASLKDLLVEPLGEARKHGLKLVPARPCRASDTVSTILADWDGQAILVLREEAQELFGILTPYDLL